MEGHSSGPPSPTGMMEFTVTGQFSSSDDTRSGGDRIRNDQLKLQGMGDSSRFPQKRWLAASQALKDTEVLNQAGRGNHISTSLCGSSLNIFCDRHFHTHLSYSARRQQGDCGSRLLDTETEGQEHADFRDGSPCFPEAWRVFRKLSLLKPQLLERCLDCNPIDIWGQVILCCGGITQCVTGCGATAQASHKMPVARPHLKSRQPKCLQTWFVCPPRTGALQ